MTEFGAIPRDAILPIPVEYEGVPSNPNDVVMIGPHQLTVAQLREMYYVECDGRIVKLSERFNTTSNRMRDILQLHGIGLVDLAFQRRRDASRAAAGRAKYLRPRLNPGSEYIQTTIKTESGKYKDVKYHRFVLEQAGIKLCPGDMVHHIDYNKLNNDISNLCVLDRWEHGYVHHTNTHNIMKTLYRMGVIVFDSDNKCYIINYNMLPDEVAVKCKYHAESDAACFDIIDEVTA